MNSRSGLILVRSRPMFCGARLAADGDQDFFGFDFLLLAFGGDGDGDSCLGLFDFVDFRAGVEVDAALAIDAREFLRDFFIFNRDEPRQHFDDRHFGVERAVDRSELDANGACADDHDRLGELFQTQNFDVGQDAIAGFETGEHTGFRTGGEDDVLCF